MKAIRIGLGSLFFAALFAVSVMGQTANLKIGVVDTRYFAEEQGGITKYINALKSLDNEFKPDIQKLQSLANQMNALKSEIDTLQKNQSSSVPVKQEDVNTKVSEYNRIGRELKYQQEDLKARQDSRSKTVLAPVTQDIMKALQEYSQKNGFSMILDGSKLDDAGLVLAFDRTLDVTQDFIKFYNARPAGTAAKIN